MLASAGFAPAMIADASFVINSYVVGFVLDETLGGGPGDATSARRMREEGMR